MIHAPAYARHLSFAFFPVLCIHARGFHGLYLHVPAWEMRNYTFKNIRRLRNQVFQATS